MPIVFDEEFDTDSKVLFSNDINDWVTKNYSEWRSGLSDESVEGIKFYSGWGHIDINEQNRGEKPITDNIKSISDNISSGLSKASLPEDITVYRAVSEDAIVDMALQSGGRLESGIIIEDDGFLSTSMTTDTSFIYNYNYIMKLTAVSGLHGAPLQYGDLAVIPEEDEMLFDKGCNIYIAAVRKKKRSEIIDNYNGDDEVIVLEGILTI